MYGPLVSTVRLGPDGEDRRLFRVFLTRSQTIGAGKNPNVSTPPTLSWPIRPSPINRLHNLSLRLRTTPQQQIFYRRSFYTIVIIFWVQVYNRSQGALTPLPPKKLLTFFSVWFFYLRKWVFGDSLKCMQCAYLLPDVGFFLRGFPIDGRLLCFRRVSIYFCCSCDTSLSTVSFLIQLNMGQGEFHDGYTICRLLCCCMISDGITISDSYYLLVPIIVIVFEL